jgi:GNAT superfamily N-acetyltransferase
VAFRDDPSYVDRTARERSRGRFFVCAAAHNAADAAAQLSAYKALGYRLLATEPLFVHRLVRVPRATSPATIERVRTTELAARFGQATRRRPLASRLLVPDAPLRQYVALVGDELVGWVRSINAGDSSWCADMYVRPLHRRRGIGRALLAHMLRDDRNRGARRSVLLSSHAGALVYPKVGYEQIGQLLILVPRRNRALGT